MNLKSLHFVVLHCVLICNFAGTRASPCAAISSCQECLAQEKCMFVFGRLTGESESTHICADSATPRSAITVLSRIRTIKDCSQSDDVTIASDSREEFREVLENMNECPLASPLLIAFFVTSILLAISVSIMCTIFCWPVKEDRVERSGLSPKPDCDEERRPESV